MWFPGSGQWVLKARDITFVSAAADIRAGRAPRIIHRGPRWEMEGEGEGGRVGEGTGREVGGGCDRRIISAPLSPWRPHAV